MARSTARRHRHRAGPTAPRLPKRSVRFANAPAPSPRSIAAAYGSHEPAVRRRVTWVEVGDRSCAPGGFATSSHRIGPGGRVLSI